MSLGRWVKAHGVARSVYVDRHGIYRDQEHPEKPTQFGRAMKELNVELIQARSPQAKGRVERKHRVFQDRLVKELRLRGISDMEQANALLGQDAVAGVEPAFFREGGPGGKCASEGTPGDRGDSVHARGASGGSGLVCPVEEPVAADRSTRGCGGPCGQEGDGQAVRRWNAADRTRRATLALQGTGGRPTPAVKTRPMPMQVNNRRYRPGPDHPFNREARAIQASRARAAAASSPPPRPGRGGPCPREISMNRVTILLPLRG